MESDGDMEMESQDVFVSLDINIGVVQATFLSLSVCQMF